MTKKGDEGAIVGFGMKPSSSSAGEGHLEKEEARGGEKCWGNAHELVAAAAAAAAAGHFRLLFSAG
jgi:hypothetical protein